MLLIPDTTYPCDRCEREIPESKLTVYKDLEVALCPDCVGWMDAMADVAYDAFVEEQLTNNQDE